MRASTRSVAYCLLAPSGSAVVPSEGTVNPRRSTPNRKENSAGKRDDAEVPPQSESEDAGPHKEIALNVEVAGPTVSSTQSADGDSFVSDEIFALADSKSAEELVRQISDNCESSNAEKQEQAVKAW